jgi:hypothetical protein
LYGKGSHNNDQRIAVLCRREMQGAARAGRPESQRYPYNRGDRREERNASTQQRSIRCFFNPETQARFVIGGQMEEERTLLQQIRDKEQEFSKKIEIVKQETDAQIAAAKNDRDTTVQNAGRSGKTAAEELYLKEKQKTDGEIERMKKTAAIETEKARKKGERNLKPAVEKIVSYVINE